MARVLIPAIETPPILPFGRMTRFVGRAMGTGWSVQAYLPDRLSSAAAAVIIENTLASIISQMSQWEPDSFISRFNVARAGEWLTAPEHFRIVLAEALRIASLTAGAFDPALGAFTDLWGFGPVPAPAAAPSPLALRTARRGANWRALAIDGDRVRQPGVTLDFSGIAKGYAVDMVTGALRDLGAPAGLVEIGGELSGWGVKDDGAPWWVELEAVPGGGGASRLTLALNEMAVATTGDFRRARYLGGRRISHTLDPATGAPLGPDAPALVSVVHKSCMSADAFATALSVMGVEQGLAFAAGHDIAARFMVRRDGHVEEMFSSGMSSMLY